MRTSTSRGIMERCWDSCVQYLLVHGKHHIVGVPLPMICMWFVRYTLVGLSGFSRLSHNHGLSVFWPDFSWCCWFRECKECRPLASLSSLLAPLRVFSCYGRGPLFMAPCTLQLRLDHWPSIAKSCHAWLRDLEERTGLGPYSISVIDLEALMWYQVVNLIVPMIFHPLSPTMGITIALWKDYDKGNVFEMELGDRVWALR